MSLRKDFIFILAVLAAILLYFPEVLLLKAGFLSGDHRAQHYPWATFYAEGLKAFRLPWWTKSFHCGFPLLAEGQVGAFYPLNLIFYFFLPTFAAYNYGILVNYVIGGLFFYGYLRTIQLSEPSSFLGTLVYLFGTAQGGFYYNVISLKVLIWLPLSFCLIDRMLEEGKRGWVAALWTGVVFAVQIFGGYLQYAVYSIAFSLFYFLWFSVRKCWMEKAPRLGLIHLGLLGASLFTAFLTALPQLGSTWELAGFSRRFGYPQEFAYVGSMNPFAFATLFFPHWDGFLGSELYVGIVGLFFLILSLMSRKDPKELFFWAMAVFALALALGRFSPLYVAIVKSTGFSGFRIPAKFLFFVGFAAAVLCAYGFEKWLFRAMTNELKQAHRVFSILCLIGVSGFFLANGALRVFSTSIRGLLRDYIERNFSHSLVHTLPLEAYFSRLEGFYEEVLTMTSILDPWNLCFLAFLLLGWLAVKSSLISKANRTQSSSILFLLLFFNFYPYGFTTVKGNYETYGFIDRPSLLVDRLKQDQGIFRVHRLFRKVENYEKLPLIPHVNMLHGLDTAGAYSPLVFAGYYEEFRDLGLGDVNDSHRLLTWDPASLAESNSFLNFLNVKYLLSDEELGEERFVKIKEEGGSFLYENPQFLPRAFFVKSLDELMKTKPEFEVARLIQYDQEEMEVQIETQGPGYLVTSELYYPGWRVRVNGREAGLLKAKEIFRAVEIRGKGEQRVRFFYDPIWKKLAFLPWAVPLTALFATLLVKGERPKKIAV